MRHLPSLLAISLGALGGCGGVDRGHPSEGDATAAGVGGSGAAPGSEGGFGGELASCEHVWSRGFGAGSMTSALAVAPDGTAFAGGMHLDEIDFGGGPRPDGGNDDHKAWAASFGPDGAHQWSASYGHGGDQDVTGVALAGEDVVFAGYGNGALDIIGDISPPGGESSYASWYAEFTDGEPSSSVVAGGADSESRVIYGDIAAMPDGDLVVVGAYRGDVDVGAGPITSAGEFDAFVVHLGRSGSGSWWTVPFGDASGEEATAVAVDGQGRIVVVGGFGGTIDLGGEPITADPRSGWGDGFVIQLDGDGTHRWSRRFEALEEQRTADVAVNAAGDIVVAGWYRGVIDLGGGIQLTSAGARDGFVVRLDAMGNTVWAKSIGGPGEQDVLVGVDWAPNGDVLLAGRCDDGCIVDGHPVPPAGGGLDALVMRLDGAGTPRGACTFGDSDFQGAHVVAVGADGDVWLGGMYTGAIDFGGGPFEAELGGFVTRLRVGGETDGR